jgi:Transposase
VTVSKLTPELRAEVERELAAGQPVAVVAQRHGLSRRTLTRWIADGRVVRRELTAEPDPALSELSLDERLAKAEPGLVAAIIAASQRGSWQASAWLLERINPRRWARPQRPEARGPGQARVPDPIWAEIDELAARRRAQPRAVRRDE